MFLDVKMNAEAARAEVADVPRQPGTGRYAGTRRRTLPADTAWAEFLASARTRVETRDAHDILFHEDDPAEHIYEVVSGQVMLYRLLADGRRQVVDIVSAGDLIGLSMTGLYDCSAETLTGSDVRVLERRDVERSRDLQTHVNRCLMTRIESLHSHAVLLGRKSAQERVASFLMRFVPKRGVVGCVGPAVGGDEQTVVLRMTRQEIADYLGLTIETVSRVLSDMKRRGVISIEKNDRIRMASVCRVCKLTGIH
ncbi:Crp/Fnr family transcriptional regulator [Chthonobacter rhizosphaerae]|uniref:Crp/Fnr family transcriptional regulator n=1 Tax=Chthonobacter rhizosphaerae TaxID=2735553 RepID=UPI001AEEAD82|nr:helix-turn-helix domain-containing protein [Chthonobacter rhizosphaerae]